MRRSLVCIAAMAALSLTPFAFADDRSDVMKAEEIYRQAKLHQDINALNLILADGFNETNQNGNSRSKAETMDLWKWFSITSLTTDSAEVRVAGNTAMVLGAQTENGSEHMLFTRVYVRGANGWQLLASMQYRDPRRPENTVVR